MLLELTCDSRKILFNDFFAHTTPPTTESTQPRPLVKLIFTNKFGIS